MLAYSDKYLYTKCVEILDFICFCVKKNKMTLNLDEINKNAIEITPIVQSLLIRIYSSWL